jgi:hypothetical protein
MLVWQWLRDDVTPDDGRDIRAWLSMWCCKGQVFRRATPDGITRGSFGVEHRQKRIIVKKPVPLPLGSLLTVQALQGVL